MEEAEIGTWQVEQSCHHGQGDGTWWCLEPTHLTKCLTDHLPKASCRSPPKKPHAIYCPLPRGGQLGPRGPKPLPSVENHANAGKSQAPARISTDKPSSRSAVAMERERAAEAMLTLTKAHLSSDANSDDQA